MQITFELTEEEAQILSDKLSRATKALEDLEALWGCTPLHPSDFGVDEKPIGDFLCSIAELIDGQIPDSNAGWEDAE